MTETPARVRVALDLLGGSAPGAVVDGALLVTDERPEIEVVLVGPEEVAAAALSERSATGRLSVVPAARAVGPGDDPVRAVRAARDVTIRVATRLVRDGTADAAVSAGPLAATAAAALFTLRRLPGVTRLPVAVVLPAAAGPVVLLDAGAAPDAAADLLAQFAVAGSAYAGAALGIGHPRVALLGGDDALRRAAAEAIAALPVSYAGQVGPEALVTGGAADVVVTDATGAALVLATLRAAGRADLGRPAAGLLLGVDGVTAVAAGPDETAAAIELAAGAVRTGVVAATAAALQALVAKRRADAGWGVAQ